MVAANFRPNPDSVVVDGGGGLDGTDYLSVGMKKKTRWEILRRRGDKSQR
jgi:hypothetical protein